MVHITGKYILIRNENFKEYLIANGIPEQTAIQIDSLKPTFEVLLEGNTIFLNTDTAGTNSTSILTLGEEVDEPIPSITTLKSKAELNGDTLTVTSTAQNGNIGVRLYTFSDSALTITLTSPNIVDAKRIYKRI